jgi:two-component system, cell cycle sensor histidine kinase and response regulator CckA
VDAIRNIYEMNRSRKQILVVEDESIVAMDLQDRLESLGYDVPATVATGKRAIEKTESLRPDLVLMDIQLQDEMDGVQAADEIRRRFDVPIVFVTANADDGTIQRAKVTEPFGYVMKPFDEKSLETTIEMALYKHAAEKKLRESERWLSATLRGIGDAVIATDEQAVVTFMNPVAEALTGWAEGDAKRRSLAEVFQIVDEDRRDPLDPVHQVLQEKTIVNSSKHSIIIHRDGREAYVDHSAAPLKDEQANLCGVVLVFRDVSDRKRAQAEMFEREEQLRQARKMEAVGQLAGGIAHDFNNTLTAVLGYADLLLRESGVSDSSRRRLEAIKSGGEHAAALTAQLLAFSRKQMLQPKVLNLNDLVSQSLVLLDRLIGEHIKILPSLQQDPWRIKVDPNQIQQVVMNLAINAADAMASGGTMTIETSNVTLDEQYARHHVCVVPGDYVMLAVSDTGHGIDKAIQSRVFEPFFTTKDKAKGAGIGLATVFGIVKQSGGNIWVYSEPGLGTTFKVYLPVISETVKVTPKAVSVMPGGTETILLVEDEECVRAVAKEMLETSGYNVLVAKDGVDALKVCQQSGSAIDLLLSDVIMPHMNGQELARRALAVKPDLRVLFMSGYTDDAIVHHGVIDNSAHFIQKPFSTEAFLVKIRNVFNSVSIV